MFNPGFWFYLNETASLWQELLSVRPSVHLSISSRHACHQCVLFSYFLSAFASSLRNPHSVFWFLLPSSLPEQLGILFVFKPIIFGCLYTLGCEAFIGEWSALKKKFSPSQQLSAANSFLGSNRMWLLAHLPLHAGTLSGLSCTDLMHAVTTAERVHSSLLCWKIVSY